MGGGPAGCALAGRLDDVMVIEEHSQIGEPMQCAGLVGENVFTLGASKRSILNVIDGARIFFRKDSFLLKKPSVAYVIDRVAFDRQLAEGADIRKGTRYLSCRSRERNIQVKTTRGDFECEYLVGADGSLSSMRRVLGLKPTFYPVMQYTVEGNFEKSLVHLYIEKPFFFYIVPENEARARIGCILSHPKKRLDSFLEDNNLGRIVSKTAGVIPLGMGRTASERIALLGDAACQLKPLTGGGLYFGLKAALHLAHAIRSSNLLLYERLWRKDFGWDIRSGLLLRHLYESMSEREIGNVFLYLKENREILEECDFDRHITPLKKLAHRKSTYRLIPLFARLLARHIFL